MLFSRRVQASPRDSFQPVAAGGLLICAVGVCAGAGALAGWAAGSTGLGALGGVVVGIPVGVATVYRRFRGYFT